MVKYKEIDKMEALSNWWDNPILLKDKLTGKIFKLKIETDDNPWNPREDCDNLCTITSGCGYWGIGDECLSKDELAQWRTTMNERALRGEVWWAPVYMYDHSGQTISLTDFNDRWDSGICGFIWVEKQKVFTWYPAATETNWKEFAQSAAETEIKLYDQYIQGDVYVYTLYVAEETEHRRLSDNKAWTTTEWEFYESVGGFYGDPLESGLIDDAITMVAASKESTTSDVVFIEEEK